MPIYLTGASHNCTFFFYRLSYLSVILNIILLRIRNICAVSNQYLLFVEHCYFIRLRRSSVTSFCLAL